MRRPPHTQVSVYAEPAESDEPMIQALAPHVDDQGEVTIVFDVALYPRIAATYVQPAEGGPEIEEVWIELNGERLDVDDATADWLIDHFEDDVYMSKELEG